MENVERLGIYIYSGREGTKAHGHYTVSWPLLYPCDVFVFLTLALYIRMNPHGGGDSLGKSLEKEKPNAQYI